MNEQPNEPIQPNPEDSPANKPESEKPLPKVTVPSQQPETPPATTSAQVETKGGAVIDTKFARSKTQLSMNRRSFIKWAAIGWTAFAAIVAGYGTLMLRFLFPNVLFEPKQSFLAGYPDDYTVGEVSERFKSSQSVWLVRDAEKIYALSTVCTHLGCTPNWLGNEAKFKCPCHGSGFYKTGINFEGPAPRPLERFKITLSDDGELIIDKTKKFQQEKGEWSDPESYVLA